MGVALTELALPLHLFPGTQALQASALTLGLAGWGQAIGTSGDSWNGL